MSRGLGKCSCLGKEADIQIAIALYKRVGVSKFGQGVLYGLEPRGPLSQDPDGYELPVTGVAVLRDPLYLVVKSTLTWADPAATTFTNAVKYDPYFCDMTVAETGPTIQFPPGNIIWQPTNQTNVPAAYENGFYLIGAAIPLNDPNGTFFYVAPGDPNSQPITTYTSDGTTATISAPTYYDDNGNVHYGYTFTMVLSQPFAWADQAAIAGGWLAAITLQDGTLNPAKTYPLITPDGTRYNMRLRYFCEMPKNSNDPTYTNTLFVRADRVAGFAFGSPELLWGNPDLYFSDVDWVDWQWGAPPCSAATNPTTHISKVDLPARYPLAAHGMPFTQSPPTSPVKPSAAMTTGGCPGAPALSGHYLFSAKSSVRASGAGILPARSLIYDPAADQLTLQTLSTNPVIVAGEQIFTPDQVGGLGALVGVFSGETTCTSSLLSTQWPASPQYPALIPGGDPQTVARNQKITVYSVTFDAHGNWLRNAPAQWQLVDYTGLGLGAVTPACLAVSPDGSSAIFTAPNAPGRCTIVTTVPGCAYQMGVSLQMN